jgi:hypothetical protein
MNNKIPTSVSGWLDSQEGKAVVDKLTKRLCRNRIIKKLLYIFDLEACTDPEKTIRNTIASELIIFLNKPRIAGMITDGRCEPNILCTAFINHCRDLARKYDRSTDAYRNFDRHVDDILRNSEAFFRIMDTKKEARFSTRKNAPRVPRLPDEYIAEISFPMERFADLVYEKINKKDTLTELAAYFVESVAAFYNEPAVYVLRYDFVRWIARHVQLAKIDKIPLDAPSSGPPGGETDSLSAGDRIGDFSFIADRLYYREKVLPQWAENFLNQMSPKQQTAFFFYFCDEMTLEETAEKMGLKQASGVTYHLDEAKSLLRYFLRDLPGLSPDHQGQTDDELFMDFRDHLCLFLKNKLTSTVN